MKATEDELEDLRRRIALAHARCPLSKAEIGRLAKVHPSQVGRVVRGDFLTVSANVVQICKVLGLEMEVVERPAERRDAAWSRLEASVRRLWDETPQGADRIAMLLDTIADLQAG
jgi:hypothetical protein